MKYIALLTLAAILAGCGGVRAPITTRQDPWAYQQVHTTDGALRRYTAVQQPILARDPQTDVLYVELPIRNTRNMQVHVDYQVSFYDANGQTLWQSGWMTKVLPPHVPDRIRVNSPRADAADFLINLRYAQ